MEILHKWTVGPAALNQLKIGYSLKLSVTGAACILIGGFISVGGANKEKTPKKKNTLRDFTFVVLQEDEGGAKKNKAANKEGKDSKVLREKRKSVTSVKNKEIGEENATVYIQNGIVRYSLSKRDLDQEQNDLEKGRRKRFSEQLETFWETNEEEVAVGEDAMDVYKRHTAGANNQKQTHNAPGAINQRQTHNRRRRHGVDESAKARVLTQNNVTNQNTRSTHAGNMTAPKTNIDQSRDGASECIEKQHSHHLYYNKLDQRQSSGDVHERRKSYFQCGHSAETEVAMAAKGTKEVPGVQPVQTLPAEVRSSSSSSIKTDQRHEYETMNSLSEQTQPEAGPGETPCSNDEARSRDNSDVFITKM